MKLTKTEHNLIREAAIRGGFYAIETMSGRGAFGGRVQAGARERAALLKLVDRGVVRIVNRDTSVEYTRGHAITVTLLRYQIIETV